VLTILLTLSCHGTPETPSPGFRQDAVLLVWIPYDNDLGRFAPAVIEGLRAGTEGGMEVAAQLDRPDQPGMELVTLADGRGQTLPVAAEDSGSPEAFAEFLAWAEKRYEARRYGVVVMNHGGDLGHVARDDHPDGPAPSWLPVSDLAELVAGFREREPGEVELLALQVCGKASIEALRVVAPAARTTLASQLPLAAPNTWYADALPQIAAHPDWTGPEWVRAIAEADAPQMYGSISCVDNAALLAEPLPSLTLPRSAVDGLLAPVTWMYAGETYVDLGAALTWSGQPRTLVDRTLCGHYLSESPADGLLDGFPSPDRLSGLSIAAQPARGGALTVTEPPEP